MLNARRLVYTYPEEYFALLGLLLGLLGVVELARFLPIIGRFTPFLCEVRHSDRTGGCFTPSFFMGFLFLGRSPDRTTVGSVGLTACWAGGQPP